MRRRRSTLRTCPVTQYVVVLKIAPSYGLGTLPGQKFVAFETNVAHSGPTHAS